MNVTMTMGEYEELKRLATIGNYFDRYAAVEFMFSDVSKVDTEEKLIEITYSDLLNIIEADQ